MQFRLFCCLVDENLDGMRFLYNDAKFRHNATAYDTADSL